MKISKNVVDDLYSVLVLLILISLPFTVLLNSYLVVFTIIFRIVLIFFGRKLIINLKGILFFLFFGLIFISVLMSENFSYHYIEKNLSLIVFPIIFSDFKFINKISLHKYLDIFSTTISIILFLCIIYGLYRYLFLEPPSQNLNGDLFNGVASKWNFLSYTAFLTPVNMHPTYMSLYTNFALFYLITSKITLDLKTRYFLLFNSLILIISIFLIGSRVGILTFVIFSLVGVFSFKKTDPKLKLLFILSITLISTLLIISNKTLLDRISIVNSFAYPEDISGWNSINLRRAIWSCNWDLFMNNPVFGVGFSDVSFERLPCYEKYGFVNAFGNYNSHNQYLELSIRGGLLMLFVFLLILFMGFLEGIKKRNTVLLMFLGLISIYSITESILLVQKGIVFFCLLYFIAINIKKNVSLKD